MKRIFTLITTIIFATQFSCAQEDSSLDFVNKSLAAYGNWNSINTFEYEVVGKRDAGAQARAFKNGALQSYSSKRTYNLAERQLFEINTNYFPGGYVFKFATFVNDTTAFQYDVLGSRTGKIYYTGGKVASDGRLSVRNNHISYFKVRELLNFKENITLIDADTNEFIIIRRLDSENTPIADYHFSRRNHLLQKLTAGSQKMVFSDYTNNNGRMDNGVAALYSGNTLIYEENIAVVNTGFTFDTSLLELPSDYVKGNPKPVSSPMEISKDIFLIENLAGDRNVLFVNMDEYIVVIEAPISSDLSKQVINMIKDAVPGKPIKYVFSTHYHNDHTGGLRQYVYEGSELIMTAHTQEYVKVLVSTPKQDDLGDNEKEASFQTIKDVLILKDKNHIIEFHEVPNSHCEGMALAYFPNEKIIYQGDLLSVPQDGTLTPPIQVTKEMFQFLTKKKIKFSRMIGHHGHNDITEEVLYQIMKMKGNPE